MKRKNQNDRQHVKYGKLSAKDKEYVREFGHLPGQDGVFSDSELNGEHHKVFREEDLEDEGRQSNGESLSDDASDALSGDSGLDSPPKSAYDMLLTSLGTEISPTKDTLEPFEDQYDLEKTDDNPLISDSLGELDDEFEDDALSTPEEEEKDDADDSAEGVDDIAGDDPYYLHYSSGRLEEMFGVDTGQVRLYKAEDKVLGSVSCSGDFKVVDAVDSLPIKRRLLAAWNSRVDSELSPLQSRLLPQMLAYRDVVYTSRRNEENDELMELFALHSLNHIYKVRDRVLKNNEKLRKRQSRAHDSPEDEDDIVRDQGFTRAKVLVLFPYKNSAYEFVQRLVPLSNSEQIENKKRFFDEFAPESKEDDPSKPRDYNAIFRGNLDDCFRLGIRLSRKSLKFYSDFYSSDIIVASPLGIRMIVGSEGDEKRDFDFLSSIETVIVDQADVISMQNWEHLTHVFDHLNKIPQESRDCDFSRVRTWNLDGKASELRQNILVTRYPSPDVNSLVKRYFRNVDGAMRNKQTYMGIVGGSIAQLRHTFTRIEPPSLKLDHETRLLHFTEKTFSSLKNSMILQKHTCIFVPSYFDFLELRKWFKKNEIPHCCLSEYTSTPDISRSRTQFFHGHKPYLLITERFHFYRRYRIRGIRNIVFYGPPANAHFVNEFIGMINPGEGAQESIDGSTMASMNMLFSKYDALALERLVGNSQVSHMLSSSKDSFAFQ